MRTNRNLHWKWCKQKNAMTFLQHDNSATFSIPGLELLIIIIASLPKIHSAMMNQSNQRNNLMLAGHYLRSSSRFTFISSWLAFGVFIAESSYQAVPPHRYRQADRRRYHFQSADRPRFFVAAAVSISSQSILLRPFRTRAINLLRPRPSRTSIFIRWLEEQQSGSAGGSAWYDTPPATVTQRGRLKSEAVSPALSLDVSKWKRKFWRVFNTYELDNELQECEKCVGSYQVQPNRLHVFVSFLPTRSLR